MKKVCFKVMASTLLIAMVFFGGASTAYGYPTGPIRFIVPFAAGGGSDVLVRVLAPHLAREMGVTFVVENVEGAGTQIGLTALLNAPADGYTISQANQPHLAFTIAVQGATYSSSDFAWLNMHQIDDISFSAALDAPWHCFQDLIDDIRARPGEIAIGVTQMGGHHVFALYLQNTYDLDFIIVPYPGAGEGRAAVLGGHVDLFISTTFSDWTFRDNIRSIAVGGNERSPLWPDTLTILEATGNERLAEVANALASFRGVLVSRQFKENYPERFEKLVEAYRRAFYSEEHKADADRTGQTPVMRWTGPEEAERLSAGADEIVAAFAHYFAIR